MAFARSVIFAALFGAVQAKISNANYFYNAERPLVIAHRGATFHFPEESLPSFIDAYYSGTDFIEMDLQMTSDGYLICQHDPDLAASTNIAEYADAFKDRKRNDGKFYVNDFTLVELKMLKRLQRYHWRSAFENDRYDIITVNELIEEVQIVVKDFPRVINKDTTVGLYIELKDYQNTLDYLKVDMAERLNDILTHYNLSTVQKCETKMPIIIQSFESDALLKYATLSDLPLVMLLGYTENTNWKTYSENFHAVGPDSQWIMNHESLIVGPTPFHKESANNSYSPFTEKMHELQLAVHPYTLRDDELVYRKNAYDEIKLYIDNGLDGSFTEFPHTAFEIFTGLSSKSGMRWHKMPGFATFQI